MMPRTPYQPRKSGARWALSESRARSVVKTVSWRITGSSATFLIAWAIGGDLAVAGTIAALQIVANTLLYYLHERAWNLVPWGR